MAKRFVLQRKQDIQIEIEGKRKIPKGQRSYRINKPEPDSSTDRRQMCIFKARRIFLEGSGVQKQKAHLEYISRNGTSIEGGKPSWFGSTTPEKILEIAKNETMQYRFIISPERSKDINMEEFVKRVMRKIGIESRYELQWAGVIHYNTAHPHAHVIVKGVDKTGKQVVFDRDQICHRFREIIRDDLTVELGLDYSDRRQQYQIAIENTERLGKTQWDKKIEEIIKVKGKINEKELKRALPGDEFKKIRERLEFLSRIGIIHHQGDQQGSYQFPESWMKKIESSGRCESFLEVLDKARYSPKHQVRFYEPEKDQRVIGIVSWKGKVNEMADENALLLETLDGKALYVTGKGYMDWIKKGDVIFLDKREKLVVGMAREHEIDRTLERITPKGYGLKCINRNRGIER